MRQVNVIPFSISDSRLYSARSTSKRPRKTLGAATSLKPLLPLLALCEEKIPTSLRNVLGTLDVEQLQIVEIIATAISRGHL